MYSLAQDSEGFLWVGTQNGLNRYDGRSFRSNWREGERTSPVSVGFIDALLVDRRGRLWVGVDASGLHLFDRSSEQFAPVPVTTPAGAPIDAPARVTQIVQLDDQLLAGTSEGLAVADARSDRPVFVLRELLGAPAECGRGVSAAWGASPIEVWIGTPEGCLLRWDTRWTGEAEMIARLEGSIQDIALGTQGAVQVVAEGRGVFAFDAAGEVLAPPSSTSAAMRQVTTVLRSRAGDSWIATRSGLGWVPADRRDTTWFSMGQEEDGDLPDDLVSTLFEDRQGVVWVGTWNGLARLSPFHRGIRFIPVPPTTGGQPPGGVVAIQALDDEHLRLGLMGGGLATVSLAGDGWLEPDVPETSDVFSLGTGEDGDLWVAATASGVHRRSQGSWRAYRPDSPQSAGLVDTRAVSLRVDRSGVVWVGTATRGLLRYDPAVDRFEPFRVPGLDTRLAAPYVWPIVEDTEGALWFGANGPAGGIHRLSPERTDLSTYITADLERPNTGRVLTLHVSDDTLVWFGTQGGGLGRLDPASGSVTFYTEADGLPHNSVAGILEDDAGNLWMSTDGGLARFDPKSEQFWTFKERSGIQSNRFYANSALKLDDGRLLFGGPNGVTVIEPSHVVPREEAPSVALTRFAVGGRQLPEVNHVTAQRGLNLGPSENFFAFELAVLDYTDATLNAYRYMLDGLDPEWIDGTIGNVANYTSVPPGRYVFRAEARNSDGVWNRSGLAIPIVVRPPYYATSWFRLAVLALLALAARVAYQARLRGLAIVKSLRAQFSDELHHEIGASLSAIKVRSDLLGKADSHSGSRSGWLLDIERLADEATQEVREMIWVVREENDTLKGLIERMMGAADTLLGNVIEHSFRACEPLPQRAISMELRRDTYSIFKEMLQNVIKHSRATRVEIDVSWTTSHLVVTVTDNGIGFAEGIVVRGVGLDAMRRRAEEHDGRFEIESAPGHGTRLTLTVRLRRQKRFAFRKDANIVDGARRSPDARGRTGEPPGRPTSRATEP